MDVLVQESNNRRRGIESRRSDPRSPAGGIKIATGLASVCHAANAETEEAGAAGDFTRGRGEGVGSGAWAWEAKGWEKRASDVTFITPPGVARAPPPCRPSGSGFTRFSPLNPGRMTLGRRRRRCRPTSERIRTSEGRWCEVSLLRRQWPGTNPATFACINQSPNQTKQRPKDSLTKASVARREEKRRAEKRRGDAETQRRRGERASSVRSCTAVSDNPRSLPGLFDNLSTNHSERPLAPPHYYYFARHHPSALRAGRSGRTVR